MADTFGGRALRHMLALAILPPECRAEDGGGPRDDERSRDAWLAAWRHAGEILELARGRALNLDREFRKALRD